MTRLQLLMGGAACFAAGLTVGLVVKSWREGDYGGVIFMALVCLFFMLFAVAAMTLYS